MTGLLVAPVAAEDSSQGTLLTDANGSASGRLSPGAGGGFAYFFFNTAAARKPVLLTLDVDASAPAGGSGQMSKGIGFDVYRVTDGAWVAHAGAVGDDPNSTTAFAAVSNNSKGVTHLVVAYNYTSVNPNYVFSANFAPTSGTDTDKGAPVLKPGEYAVGRLEPGSSANALLSLGNIPFLPLTATAVISNSSKSLVFGYGDKSGQPSTQSKSSQVKLAVNLWSGGKLLACSGHSVGFGMNPVKGGGGVTCVGTPFVYTASVYGNAAAVKGPTDVRYVQWNAGAMNLANGDKTEIGLQIDHEGSGSQDYAVRFDRI
jgi:hypothetical protein